MEVRQRLIIGLAAVGVIAVVAALLLTGRESASPGSGPQALPPALPVPEAAPRESPGHNAEDARRAALAAAFEELQASRKSLQSSLGDLKAKLWGVELPAARARSISREMMAAQYLLKEPPLLGAFADVSEIYTEKDRVDAARAALQEIAASVGAAAPAAN